MSTREPARYRLRLLRMALVLATLVVAAHQSDIQLGALWSAQGARAAWATLEGLLDPDLHAAGLVRIARLALDSVLIGAAGTLVALALGVALALVSARWPGLADPPEARPARRALAELGRAAARACTSVLRAIPELVWAFLFVRIIGLGPGAAVLAIGLSCGGIIGKVFAEQLEAVDPAPARQLRAAGASRTGVFFHGIAPLIRGQWVGYGLFRFECAIRSGAVLGVVGAGGLGQEIALSIRYFQLDKLATALIAVLLLMLALEGLSGRLRRLPARVSVALAGATALASAWLLPIPWRDLASSQAVHEAGRFLAGFARPTWHAGFLVHAAEQALITVAMAWVATGLAAVVALALAPAAARGLTGLPAPPGARGPGALALAALRRLPGLLARSCLQLCRALPELVWALLFVLWLGPGVTAGTVAVAVHTIGTLGRLYSDTLEEVSPEPLRALEAAGAPRLGMLLYGVLPQAAPRLLSFTLYRFEVNIRATAAVGFVGAGGLGDALHTALSLFHMRDLAALLMILLLTVLVVDHLGDRARARILRAYG